ncbi:MAG TPA: NAD(P)H-dependent oxidoreductase [Steroidobacteraceae bacterium]|nr:NAD(P)H-dependent oxidoreductase [Steroidobacteraceae bacterium]
MPNQTPKPPAPTLPDVRKGQGEMRIPESVFRERLRERFYDPAFERASAEVDKVIDIAWRVYSESHKSPRTRAAGEGFADPEMQLSVQWLATRDAIAAAQRQHDDPSAKSRVLLICASARNDLTCPGEMSKTYRLCSTARGVLSSGGDFTVDFLDLSRLTAEYGRVIYPCKACVSTAMPLCHWPCSCYPNHGLGQVQDWMGDIYPLWVAAHAVMIVTPVYWYQAPSPLKLMIDRLVCADGGNPDPTSTAGKDPKKAKELELRGWSYPRHLAGRAYSVIVHGDAEGAETLRRSLSDWLSDLQLVSAGHAANIGRYVGYYEPYATSHHALDEDTAIHEEVRNAARALMGKVRELRGGERFDEAALEDPRPK